MSSIPIYPRIHFIHNSLTECYYTFNYKDPGLFTCYDMLHTITLLIHQRVIPPCEWSTLKIYFFILTCYHDKIKVNFPNFEA